MLYFPNESAKSKLLIRRKNRQLAIKESGKHSAVRTERKDEKQHDSPNVDYSPEGAVRKVSMGIPDIAKVYPEEFFFLEQFFSDVIYRAHWHFFEEQAHHATFNFTQIRHQDRRSCDPFQFAIPEEVLAIIGYEGVELFMTKFSATEVPQIIRNIDGEVTQQTCLKISSRDASLLEQNSVRCFVCERLEQGI